VGEQRKIFILEDDDSLVGALKECFERAGYFVYSSQNPTESLDVLKQTAFDFVIVDCLLPQTTGISFISRAKNENALKPETKIILISGIYTDRDFIQESIQQTKAIGFLKKPLNMNELLEIVKKNTRAVKTEKSSQRNHLYQIFSKDKVSLREKKKLLEAMEEVHGFDLPIIFNLLLETKSSGFLNLYGRDGSLSGITFCEGAITAVDIEDEMTFVGAMLIQSGYLLPDDFDKAFNDKSNSRKIGQKLVEGNLLSPHALDIVLREQMNIRLSRTLVDEKVKINFVSTSTDPSQPSIDSEGLTEYLHNWVASKITLSWLRAHYFPSLDYYLIMSPSLKPDSPVFDVPLSQNLPAFSGVLSKKKTLRELMKIQSYHEGTLLKFVHFLVIKGALVFGERASLSELQRRENLEEIRAKLMNPQFGEVFRMYFSFVEKFDEGLRLLLGEEPLPTQPELFEAWKSTQNLIREKYNSEMVEGYGSIDKSKSDFEIKIRATKLIDDAKNSLYLMKYKEAKNILQQASELSTEVSGFHLMNAWTKIGLIDSEKKLAQIQDIEIEILQIPPDEKYDANYLFVLGLLAKAKGDLSAARKNFEKAVGIDPQMIMARRELNLIKSSEAMSAAKQDIFTRDLKDVVSGFFKKK
jgi:ActR/RegA family two-component response regulator/tetratricopeptide (TPR) repeat protein